MTADLTYPDYRRGTFDALLDGYRCTDVRGGRRCQLYAKHHHNPSGTPHAHAVSGAMRFRRYVEGTWYRWNDDGEAWEQAPGWERLAWCRMGAA